MSQFEDFQTAEAFDILERMRDRMLCFNDDIQVCASGRFYLYRQSVRKSFRLLLLFQGTGAVVLAGLINGIRQQGTEYKDARICFFGAGSSALGVAAMIAELLVREGQLDESTAMSKIYMIDSKGVITNHRGDKLSTQKARFAQGESCPNMKELKDIVDFVRPHALFGLSGNGPSFPQEVISTMCKHVDRPMVFPLSNPTSKAEITHEQAIHWSDGNAIFAAGSPFNNVEYNGKTYKAGQSNNALIFPGLGFGAASVGATHIPEDLFVVAAKALANTLSSENLREGQLYPNIENIREISLNVATETAEAAYDRGIATKHPRPGSMRNFLQQRRFEPRPSAA